MRKKLILKSGKLILLVCIFTLSLFNLKSTIEKGLTDNENISFINEKPSVDYVLKKIVYVSGAVKNPGVYELKKDNIRLLEVIHLAGGLSSDADLNYIDSQLNLADVVKDSQHIFIPSQTNPSIQNSKLVNINTASITELSTLPGVGDTTAQKIIDLRPYYKIEDIKNVPGIGESKYNKLKDLVTVK